MPLVFVRAVPQFTQRVGEYRPCQGVFASPLLSPTWMRLRSSTLLMYWEQEQRPFNLAEALVVPPPSRSVEFSADRHFEATP
jgi:hypothetical protein